MKLKGCSFVYITSPVNTTLMIHINFLKKNKFCTNSTFSYACKTNSVVTFVSISIVVGYQPPTQVLHNGFNMGTSGVPVCPPFSLRQRVQVDHITTTKHNFIL